MRALGAASGRDRWVYRYRLCSEGRNGGGRTKRDGLIDEAPRGRAGREVRKGKKERRALYLRFP